jgi:ubiquinone biosynthesis protein UbiJ
MATRTFRDLIAEACDLVIHQAELMKTKYSGFADNVENVEADTAELERRVRILKRIACEFWMANATRPINKQEGNK